MYHVSALGVDERMMMMMMTTTTTTMLMMMMIVGEGEFSLLFQSYVILPLLSVTVRFCQSLYCKTRPRIKASSCMGNKSWL